MARACNAWIRRLSVAAAVAVLATSALVVPARADEGRREDGGRPGPPARWGHGDIRRFREQDLHVWRGGRWVHGRHSGRLGWWWVVGGAWYFYPAPVYPYPNPYVPPVVVAAPPPPQAAPPYWYYCQSAGAYYPYVTSCPGGWMQVVPQTPPPPR